LNTICGYVVCYGMKRSTSHAHQGFNVVRDGIIGRVSRTLKFIIYGRVKLIFCESLCFSGVSLSTFLKAPYCTVVIFTLLVEYIKFVKYHGPVPRRSTRLEE
jgi:hypothetical protein